jgi:tetratricopeptide (TPR) repeat protein
VVARQLSQQGLNALHVGRCADAELHFREAIQKCPTNTTARYQLANCLWKRGANEEAIEQLTEALEISGRTDVGMLVELGYMHANQGNMKEAYQLSEDAIRLAPDRADCWQLRADVLREEGRLGTALAAYHRALAHDPANADARLATAEIHLEQGQAARSLAALSRLEEQIPPENRTLQMLVLKSRSLRAMQRPEDAEQLLMEVAQQQKPDPEVLVELAEAQTEAGHLAQAKRTLQEVLPLVDPAEQERLQSLIPQTARTPEAPDAPLRR